MVILCFKKSGMVVVMSEAEFRVMLCERGERLWVLKQSADRGEVYTGWAAGVMLPKPLSEIPKGIPTEARQV